MKKTCVTVPLAVMALGVFLVSCSGIRVSQDYPPSLSPARLATYVQAGEPKEKTGDPRADNPLTHQRIQKAIDEVLAEKGLVPKTQNPDITVSYQYIIQTKIQSSSHGPSVGIGVGATRRNTAFAFSTGSDLSSYDEAQLVIDFTENQSKNLVWRGTATFRVDTHTKPESMTKRINQAVEKILAQYPPKQP